MLQNDKLLLWCRPNNVPYPHIWTEFESKESRNSDKIVKYRIQDLPEDRFDDALQYMIEKYLVDEPITLACGGVDDRDFNDDYERIWRIALQQRMTLVCFREGSDEIVGLNVLVVNTKNDPFMNAIKSQSKSKVFNEFMKIRGIFYANFSPYEKYGVDKYMGSLGLLVNQKYRGLGLGVRMLQTRARMAAPFGIEISETFFSSDASNANADKVGFQLDVALTFDELNKINPSFQLTNVRSQRLTIKTLVF